MAGHSFPDLEYTACDGTKVTLDTLRCTAQVTLVSIGAGWCQPCIDETPQLEAAHAELADEGIQIIQVLFQDAQSNPATTLFCKSWVTNFSLTLPVFVDPASQSLTYFDSTAAPANIAVDRDGKVLWAVTGIVPQDLVGTLRALLP
jgi:thiol-disulfide isomerase/thioredoxin